MAKCKPVLPAADEHYDYWLGADHTVGPAILHSHKHGNWYVLIGIDEGFLFDGPDLKRFDSPKVAFKHLESILEEKPRPLS
jgi:hypothetical protein